MKSIFILWLLLINFIFPIAAQGKIPYNAYKYRKDFKRSVAYYWGPSRDTALFAAQVETESGWNELARSAYAAGLAQFTPSTARWMGRQYPELGYTLGDEYNPQWALRAMANYDRYLYDNVPPAISDDHRMAFVFASYNGGLGGLQKDVIIAKQHLCDAAYWWGCVEKWSYKSGAAFRENRGYIRWIFWRRIKYKNF